MASEITTYLGPKGYTIYKENISIPEQQFIRTELNVKPYVPKSIGKIEAFPIYRESHKKFYVPRYFGESIYGEVDEVRIPEPHSINLEFNGQLRDYQEKVVQIYKDNMNKGGGLLEIPCGRGKTVMALKILSELNVKTLVIVHKGFLLNQWVERINQFLPCAKVGTIQGQTIDIEGKDIVIGMLQSLSMKDYPQSMFENFGLTIVDEVHHIAAEVFVRSLFKIVTKYVLGLSATMQRKDGLSKVFKMFLGDIIYKEKPKGNDKVLVKVIEYKTNDEEFNETKYDFRGNPAYSTMISKLCTYNHRSEFIIKVVKDLYDEDNSRQIMILGHNKNLLTYLFKAIEHRNIASVGYYVGGMKPDALKESESKKIIIGTYSMASEALDIKTLTTLVMATPKTDVTQSIGRILRTNHVQPVVVDILDTHEVFQKQGVKRRKYYVKQNYRIIKTNNQEYDSNNWETLYEPGSKKKRVKKDDDPMKGKCLIKL